jgi:prepilin-type N-terminal cleavage/methylation domain-containing protein
MCCQNDVSGHGSNGGPVRTLTAEEVMGAKKGFTIVELLVVITIIGLLMALLLPAINSARRTARETQCLNNQRNLGQAMLTYASKKENFPGRLSEIPTSAGVTPVTWVTRLLPFLDRNDWYDAVSTNGPASISNAYMELVVCPSDPPPTLENPILNYVANTGVWDPDPSDLNGWRDTPANGVCHNLIGMTTGKGQVRQKAMSVRVSPAYVSNNDGTSTTLLLSENVRLFPTQNWLAPTYEGDTGMVWASDPARMQVPINREPELLPDAINMQMSRPSSQHAGIVMATFCDGHVARLNEEIDMTVYARLMTPNGKESQPGPGAETPPFQLQLISDAQLQ